MKSDYPEKMAVEILNNAPNIVRTFKPYLSQRDKLFVMMSSLILVANL